MVALATLVAALSLLVVAPRPASAAPSRTRARVSRWLGKARASLGRLRLRRVSWQRLSLRPGRARTTSERVDPRTRAAATTVLTEHPSSLSLLKRQFAGVKKLVTTPGQSNKTVLSAVAKPLMGPDKQLAEFKRLALDKNVATAKMIDFEGKPMSPSVIPRYVEAIERAGLRAGLRGDRAIYVRLLGVSETSPADNKRRHELYKTVVETNLSRLLAGKPMPVDRLVISEAKNVKQLLDVHQSYDRYARDAVDAAVKQGRIAPEKRGATLRSLRQIQAVPLFEGAGPVVDSHQVMKQYLSFYKKTFGAYPGQLVIFSAGSDLNRDVGPVAAHLARSVMRSRLSALQKSYPGVDFIPWIGAGSGPMRSGMGRFPQAAKMLHPGTTFTVQPDHLDQPQLQSTLKAMGDAAFGKPAPVLGGKRERAMLGLGASFADSHARTSLSYARSTVRIADLLAPLKQRGRKSTSASPLIVERDGHVYLRSAQAGADGGGYGRKLDVSGYAAVLDSAKHGDQKVLLERRQRAVAKLWPKGLSDPRAISGAFARYVSGQSLTTVCGLGAGIARAERRYGKRAVRQLRPFVRFLVQNDGFVLTKDRALVRDRISALRPELSAGQVERQVRAYFADIAKVERFLGQPIERVVDSKQRSAYEKASRKLFRNKHFRDYLRGRDIKLSDWVKVIDDVVPLLENPGWNRIG